MLSTVLASYYITISLCILYLQLIGRQPSFLIDPCLFDLCDAKICCFTKQFIELKYQFFYCKVIINLKLGKLKELNLLFHNYIGEKL